MLIAAIAWSWLDIALAVAIIVLFVAEIVAGTLVTWLVRRYVDRKVAEAIGGTIANEAVSLEPLVTKADLKAQLDPLRLWQEDHGVRLSAAEKQAKEASDVSRQALKEVRAMREDMGVLVRESEVDHADLARRLLAITKALPSEADRAELSDAHATMAEFYARPSDAPDLARAPA